MTLTADQREAVFLSIEGVYSRDRVPTALSRQDLRAAVGAIDDWIDANLASFVAAIPEPVRSATTAKQKVAMFRWCIDKRWEVE